MSKESCQKEAVAKQEEIQLWPWTERNLPLLSCDFAAKKSKNNDWRTDPSRWLSNVKFLIDES